MDPAENNTLIPPAGGPAPAPSRQIGLTLMLIILVLVAAAGVFEYFYLLHPSPPPRSSPQTPTEAVTPTAGSNVSQTLDQTKDDVQAVEDLNQKHNKEVNDTDTPIEF